MKGFQRVLCRMLVVVFTLSLMAAPCAALAETGGYVERELTMPEGYSQFSNPAALPEGGFVVAAMRGDTRLWELLTFSSLTEVESVTPLDTSLGDIDKIFVAADGQLAATLSNLPRLNGPVDGPAGPAGGVGDGPVMNSAGGPGDGPVSGGQPQQRIMMGPDGMATTVVWYGQDGTIATHFTVEGMPLSTAALNGQRFAVLGMSGVAVYDASGKTALTIDRNDVSNLAAAGDSLYLMQADKISQVDLTGSTLRSVPWSRDYSEQWAITPDGTLAMVNSTAICGLQPQGTEMERMADTARYLIGAPDSGLSGICALADGTVLAYMNGSGMTLSGGGGTFRVGNVIGGGEEAKLVAYVYDAQLDTSASIAFTVTALRDSAKLRKAVNDFQRAHPELNVRLNTSLAEGDVDSPVEDAIRTLNSDLWAGKGGDVLILDELPLSQYTAKGVLRPLDELLADVEFLPGILEGSRAEDGKLYAMPAQFKFSTLWGNKEKAASVESLASLVALPLDKAQDLLLAHTSEELLTIFYPASQAAFVDDKGNPRFDTPEFEAFLEALYSIYSAQSTLPDSSFADSEGRMSPEELQGMMNGSIALMGAEIDGTMQVALPYTIAGGVDGAAIPVPSVSGAGTTYTPSLMAGINTNTQHVDLAGEFVRSLFAPEIQGLDQMEGLPTVAASLNQMIEEAKARNKEKNLMIMVSLGDGNPIQMQQPDDAAWDALRATADTLTDPYIADLTLMGFIAEETASFFEGQATAQEAASAIQQRATAYLNE